MKKTALGDAIDRLAGLYEYGHLLAASDPAQLINGACDEIERARNGLDENRTAEKKSER